MSAKTDIQDTIWNAVNKSLSKALKNINCDKTVDGKILKVNSSTSYDVLINGDTITGVPFTLGTTLNIMDTVWIRYPCNNRKNMYIDRKK